MPPFSTAERAFQIASEGPSASIADLRQQLLDEGYFNAVDQTSYPLIRKQLRGLMRRGTQASQKPQATSVIASSPSKGVLALNFARASS